MKKRLDQLLVDLGHFSSRTKAQAVIMAGLVYVAGQKADKPGINIPEDAEIEIRGAIHPYVGRGGVKLEKALTEFKLDVNGRTALDVGASTGGFTDCLLQRGAAKVFALDVGYGQLDWKLRNDSRVVVLERINVRYLTPEKLKELSAGYELSTTTFAAIDVSFISLSKILPAVYNLLAGQAEVVALVKPQFEARREQIGKGGIVKDEQVRQEVLTKVREFAVESGFVVAGVIDSPISGADGNKEYLMHLIKGER